MALPAPVEREKLHHRRYDFEGFRRSDGLWDIEGRITDCKTYGFDNAHRGKIEAGEALHDMSVRVTMDDQMTIREVVASIDAGPYGVCPAIAPNFAKLAGLSIAPGWRKELRKRVGGTAGCTHVVEMLGSLATVAYQTLYAARSRREGRQEVRASSRLIDSCHAFRRDGGIAASYWPELTAGSRDGASD
jgi:hypothetical protein